jgi:hypothetical protein
MSINCEVPSYAFSYCLLRPNIFPNSLFSDTLNLRSYVNVRDRVPQSYKTTVITAILYAYFNLYGLQAAKRKEQGAQFALRPFEAEARLNNT